MTPGRYAARALVIGMLGCWSSACTVAARERPTPKRDVLVPRVALASADVQTTAAARTPALPAAELARPRDAQHEACGSLSRRLKAGSGDQLPNDDDRVILDYATFASSGESLDSSATHGEPIANSVRNLGPGLPCVVKRMRVGESRRVWISAALQPPGEEDPRSVPARDLVLDMTLRRLIRAPQRPIDYSVAPPAAQRTASGLRYRVLRRGTGELHPVANSRVTISHSGWTNHGVLFASSALAAEPASFIARELPVGLTEGIQLMHVGDKARFWLPERLAYESGRGSAPRGAVVFDVELLAID